MKPSVVIATAVLGLALAGCGGEAADRAPGAAASVSSALASPSASGSSGGASSPDASQAAEASAAAQAECGDKTAPRPELARQLPEDLQTVTGWQPVEVIEQGQTRAFSGVLRGTVDDLVTVRDNAADELVTFGYNQTGSDEEVGYEAEAEFEGPQEVSVKVKPLCRDYLVLTYTIRQ